VRRNSGLSGRKYISPRLIARVSRLYFTPRGRELLQVLSDPLRLVRCWRQERESFQPSFSCLLPFALTLPGFRLGREPLQFRGMYERVAVIADQRSGCEFARTVLTTSH
jgi:hypothetical protein